MRARGPFHGCFRGYVSNRSEISCKLLILQYYSRLGVLVIASDRSFYGYLISVYEDLGYKIYCNISNMSYHKWVMYDLFSLCAMFIN